VIQRHDSIGAGWAFPGGFTSGGGVRLTTGVDETDAAILMILSTNPGERVMRPDFGCEVWQQVFAPINASTLGRIEHAVRQALEMWEPRIELTRVAAEPSQESGAVAIEIAYRVRDTNDQRNLVYPFYVIPHEEPPP
jgi:uncharacterized protein